MPTGYTIDVQNGKISSFVDFVYRCSQAYGNKPATDKETPDPYYKEMVNNIDKELYHLQNMTAEEKELAALKSYQEAVERNRKALEENEVTYKRYTDMLDKVKKWTPPTEEHADLKRFMVSQLEEAIRFDCKIGSYYKEPVEKLTGEEWYQGKLSTVLREKQYRQEKYEEEVERCETINKWKRQLRHSLYCYNYYHGDD